MIYSGISLQLTGTVENHLTVYMMMTMYKLFWAESSTYYDSISFLCDFLTFFVVVVSVSAYLLGTETLCFFSRVPNTCRHGFKHPYSLLAKPASQLSLDLGQGLGKEPQMGTNQLSVCSGDCSHLAHPAGSFWVDWTKDHLLHATTEWMSPYTSSVYLGVNFSVHYESVSVSCCCVTNYPLLSCPPQPRP